MGIPLQTTDWVLHLQSGRWINLLVYNASLRRPKDAEVDGTNLRVQWELGKWLCGRLMRLSRVCREVVYRQPPQRPADLEIAGDTAMAVEWQVEAVLGHEWNDYTGRLVFLLDW